MFARHSRINRQQRGFFGRNKNFCKRRYRRNKHLQLERSELTLRKVICFFIKSAKKEREVAYGTEYLWCHGSIPSSSSNVRYGGNTSCYEILVHNKQIILDTGSGFRNLRLQTDRSKIILLLMVTRSYGVYHLIVIYS